MKDNEQQEHLAKLLDVTIAKRGNDVVIVCSDCEQAEALFNIVVQALNKIDLSLQTDKLDKPVEPIEQIEPIEPIEPFLDGDDFVDYAWWDETSMFDSNPTRRWNSGLDCYEAKYCCRVPASIANNNTAVHEWIDENISRVKWLSPI